MIRVKRGIITTKKRKKVLTLAKSYIGPNSKLSKFASEQIIQSFYYQYISRRLKKRTFKQIYINIINTILKLYNTTYSKFFGQLKKLNIFLNKKVLSFLILNDTLSFNILFKFISNFTNSLI